MSGRLVIVSGPSGVGKDTVIEAWKRRDPKVERVVACCTRPHRPGEREGVDYRFVSVKVFHQMAEEGEFLEHKLVHGNWYATPVATVDRLLAEGKTAVLKIDVQGALAVMERRPDAVSVFILPPSEEELERRIRSRGHDSEETVRLRLQNARDEMALADRYHHRIVNDDVERCVDRLVEALSA
jgi:guanylate kinase